MTGGSTRENGSLLKHAEPISWGCISEGKFTLPTANWDWANGGRCAPRQAFLDAQNPYDQNSPLYRRGHPPVIFLGRNGGIYSGAYGFGYG